MSPDEMVEEYRVSRYLRKASPQMLVDRLKDIAANLWSTDRDGNVKPIRFDGHRRILLRLYAHTMCEQGFRNPTDMRFDEAALRAKSSLGYSPPVLKKPVDFEPDCLAKFGRREHVIPALEKGILRIAPASQYNDPSLNAAQKDEELEHHVRTPNEHIMMKLHGVDANGKEMEIEPQFGEMFRYMQVNNFYVWCCGLGYDARLFKEFQADAALIIKNKELFTERFAKAVHDKIPGAAFEHRGIAYYDPYTTNRPQLIPSFSKNLKYLYQNEYRFVWRVPDTKSLAPFIVELGPLHDIATVVELA